MSHASPLLAPSAHGGAALGYRLLVLTVFLGCMPVAAIRWVAPGRGGEARPAGRSPLADVLDCARATVDHVYSMPG